ncbi:MAG TPA: sigma-54-dependent Fis family transcriptional regulator [Symbiobacteriaceae bacterium]|nr:sigma-54-dependent Fis family transcriptional regulator [Symbiobacteriaceae bacterium]
MQAPWEAIHRNVELVRTGWNSFHRGLTPVAGVRPAVLRSWERSLGAGLAPGQACGGSVWSGARLAEARTLGADLVAAAMPVMDDLQRLLTGSGQVLTLCDGAARVLMVSGEPGALRDAEGIGLVPGSDWHERCSGTNAMGTALAEGAGVTVYATEHYVEHLHHWSCVAAPIRHPVSREIQGILDLSGRIMTVNAHTEMAVTGAVRAIEARLAFLEATHRHALMEAFADRLSEARQAVLCVVDRFGFLLRTAGRELPQAPDRDFWRRAMAQVCRTGSEHRAEFEQPDGRRAMALFRPVEQNGCVIGALVEVCRPVSSAAAAAPVLTAEGLVGSNASWRSALERAAKVARLESTVLITGETGTGKEVLARAIHRASPRAAGPFVAINCGAIAPHLVSSELFGYVGGAFTGANPKGATGKVEAAQGGTLFLDEVGELPPEAQVSLLRVLQEREVVRIGSHRPTPVNVRIVAATNRDLSELAGKGAFRQDLFFRLSVVPLRLPPLRERREDILPLVEFGFRRLGAEAPALSLASCERLTAYEWPGNVRELLNLVEQAAALDEDPADLLPLAPLSATGSAGLGDAGEEERIRRALHSAGGNAAAAARMLGMSRSTLYRKLELYEIRLGRQIR